MDSIRHVPILWIAYEITGLSRDIRSIVSQSITIVKVQPHFFPLHTTNLKDKHLYMDPTKSDKYIYDKNFPGMKGVVPGVT